MEKILTIIIPTYNMEDYLGQCLDSLLLPKILLPFLEVLVIIDGGSDSSETIALSYAKLHPDTFRVISKSNGNYGSCVNHGLDEANGKYIKVLDADDFFDKEAFEKFVDHLENVDVDMIISDYTTWNMVSDAKAHYHYGFKESEVIKADSLVFTPENPLMMHAVCYRTDLLRKMHYRQTEGISYTDQEWVFMPVTQSVSVSYFPYSVYIYRLGREGQTVDIQIWEKHAVDEIVGIKKMMEFYQKNCDIVSLHHREFMERSLQHRIYIAYHFIFVRSVGRVPYSVISDLDQFVIKTMPLYYPEIEKKVNYHGLNVVGLWRRHLCLFNFYMIIRQLSHELFTRI